MNTKDLMAQLESLNKEISKMEYAEAVNANKGRYKMSNDIKALDNLEVDAIQNQKYIDRIISVNAMIDYRSNGGNITKCRTVTSKRMKRLYGV